MTKYVPHNLDKSVLMHLPSKQYTFVLLWQIRGTLADINEYNQYNTVCTWIVKNVSVHVSRRAERSDWGDRYVYPIIHVSKRNDAVSSNQENRKWLLRGRFILIESFGSGDFHAERIVDNFLKIINILSYFGKLHNLATLQNSWMS